MEVILKVAPKMILKVALKMALKVALKMALKMSLKMSPKMSPKIVPQGVPQGDDLDKWIEYQVAVYPKITTGELAQLSGKSIITIKRRIAKMPHIVYVGSGYSGHWEVKPKKK